MTSIEFVRFPCITGQDGNDLGLTWAAKFWHAGLLCPQCAPNSDCALVALRMASDYGPAPDLLEGVFIDNVEVPAADPVSTDGKRRHFDDTAVWLIVVINDARDQAILKTAEANSHGGPEFTTTTPEPTLHNRAHRFGLVYHRYQTSLPPVSAMKSTRSNSTGSFRSPPDVIWTMGASA